MACELPEIQTLEINPLHLDEQGVMAEAARISLAEPCANTSRLLPHGHTPLSTGTGTDLAAG